MCWNKLWSRNYNQENNKLLRLFFFFEVETCNSRMQVIFTTPRALCGKIKFWVERANSRIEIFVGLILVVQLRDIVLANFIRYENLGRHPARTYFSNYVDLAPACVDWCEGRVHP